MMHPLSELENALGDKGKIAIVSKELGDGSVTIIRDILERKGTEERFAYYHS